MSRRTAETLVALAAVTTLVTAAAAFAGPGPTVVLRGIPVSDRIIAITIDDGPSPVFTPRILEVLGRHRARATFFVVGETARKHPGLVRDALARGHEIETHTWSHPFMERISSAAARDEVRRGAEAVESIAGRHPDYFRPPRGTTTATQLEAVADEGMRAVTWDACLDHSADETPRDAALRVLGRIGPGDVILLHDGRGDRTRTVAALDLLLTELEARGYRFVTLSELYRGGRI